MRIGSVQAGDAERRMCVSSLGGKTYKRTMSLLVQTCMLTCDYARPSLVLQLHCSSPGSGLAVCLASRARVLSLAALGSRRGRCPVRQRYGQYATEVMQEGWRVFGKGRTHT